MNFKGPLKVPWVKSYIILHRYLTMGFEGGPPYYTESYRDGSFQTRNFKFRRYGLNEGIRQRNFKGPLKDRWVKFFIKLHRCLTKGSEGGPPLLSRAPMGRLVPNAKFQISLE